MDMRFVTICNSFILSLLAVFVTAGCSPLSKTQIEAVNELTFRSDTIIRSPAVLFEKMSALRLERGLFYAPWSEKPQAMWMPSTVTSAPCTA